MNEKSQLLDIFEDLGLLLKQNEILGKDFDNFLKKLKSNVVKNYLLALRNRSQPEQALKDNFFASGSLFAKHLFKNLSPEVGGETGFIDYLIKAGREEISLEIKPLFEAEFEKGKSGLVFKKIKKIKLSWERHKDQIRKYLGRRGEFVVFTNLEEWYYFSRNYSLDETCNYFASSTLFELLDDFKQVDDFWQYLDKQEDLSVKEPLDKKFFSSLKSWVQELRKVKFSVDEKEKTKLIINLINKFIFIQSLDKFWVIQGKYIENKWSNIEREWQAKNKLRILKKFLGEINEYFYELYDTELFRDGENGKNILDYIQKDEENIELFYRKLKLVLGIDYGATAIGWVRGVIQYNFRRIDEDILGKAYETFLAEVRKEQGIYYTPKYITQYIVDNTVGKQYEELLDKIKNNLEKTKFEECKGLIEKFVSIKVLDPACGSGSFLIKALKIIWSKYEELNQLLDSYYQRHNNFKGTLKQSAEDKEISEKINKLKKILDYKDKRDLISKIIIRHIHGNDLDGNALEVAKVNLWLEAIKLAPREFQYDKLPADTNHILPDLEVNLGNGDSLVGLPEDRTIEFLKENYIKELKEMSKLRKKYLKNPTDEEAIEQLNKIKQDLKKKFDNEFKQYLKDNNLPEEIFEKTKPFHWALEFWYVYFDDNANIKPKEQHGFDAVIGNPPYVKAKLMDKIIRKFLDEGYSSSTGTYDVYVNFIEKSCEILNGNGVFSFINPSKFIFTDYGIGIRKYISAKLKVDQFIDFRDAQVFDEATNYTCLLFLSKTIEKTYEFSFAIAKSKRANLKEMIEDISQFSFNKEDLEKPMYSIRIGENKILKESGWWLISKKQTYLLSKLDKGNIPLRKISYKIFQGLVITPIEVFAVKIIKNGEKEVCISPIKPEKNNEAYWIENDLLKPILKSSDIHKYIISPENYFCIFPYKFGKKKNGEFEWSFINEIDMKKEYPKTLHYLRNKIHFLEEREEGRWKGSDKWYEYSRQQNFGCHQLKKIITPGISTKANYSVDNGGFYIDRGSYGIIIKEEIGLELEFLVATLNSKLLDFYLKMIAPLISGGYYSYQTKYLKYLPIFKATEQEQKPIIQLVEKIITLKKLQHKFREIWRQYSQKFRNSYRSLGEILLDDKQEVQEGNFDKVWVSEASVYPNGTNELIEKEFDNFRIVGENNNILKIFGISGSNEELILELKAKNKEFRDILYLEILELFDSRSKVKSLKDIFDKTIISVIQPNIWENSGNLIKGAKKKFEEWLEKQNFKVKEKDIIKIDNQIQDVDNQIDAHIFKLYKLNKEEVETVLDSLNILENVRSDILRKFERLGD